MYRRNELINEWGTENITFFEESIWTSSIQHEDLTKVRSFLENNNFNFVDISIVRPPTNDSSRIFWKHHYEVSGKCISTNYQKEIVANSNHLKLTVGLEKEENSQEYQNKTISVINVLRIIFGVPIANELVLLKHFNSENSEGSTRSQLGFASPFLTQALNMYPDIEEIKVKSLPVEASILLDKAFEQNYPIERFILMWTGFETIINHIVDGNKSNGLKRKIYFDKLGSEKISNEVFRLFNVRCNLFKEGKILSAKQLEDENWSLYSILQLLIMEDCPVRTKFLKGYENTLEY